MTTQRPNKDYILIIGASELVMPAYRIAREELGLGLVAMDYDIGAPGMQYADYALEVSTKDVSAAIKAAWKIARRVRLKGVFTCGADVEITVAAVAESQGLPSISLGVAQRCNDKLLMHKFLDAQNFEAKAYYQVVGSLPAVLEAVEAIGFPCIIKPLDNCASRGVQRLESMDEVEAAYALAVFHNGDRGGEVLIEACLEGSKHTIELIAWQGQRHLLSIIDTHYISPRWPCETGLNTTTLPLEIQQNMFTMASEVAELIGIDFGAHKVDVNVDTSGRIRLIELTARLSGGFHCQYASPLAFGSHDIRAALRLAVGESLNLEDIRHRHECGAAVRAIFPPPGRVTSIAGVTAAKGVPGVAEVFVWTQKGATLGPYHNSADRPAFVIAAGDTTAQAIASAERGVALVNIETKA